MASGEAEAEAVVIDGLPGESRRSGAPQRASSITTAPATASRPTRARVTERDARTRIPAVLAHVRAGAHVTGQLPSIQGQRDRHHAAARRHDAGVFRALRLGWGYFHLAVKTVLNALEWVTETPSRFLLAAALIAVAVLSLR